MTRSLRLGTAFGIGIYVHWTFLLLPAWVLFSTWGSIGPQMVVFLFGLIAAIFGCVVLHELGHALMARYFGIQTRDITLYPIGGVARLERMSERPHEEFLIAIAGPAVNVVISIALVIMLALTGAVVSWETLFRSMPGGFLLNLLTANVFLVVFNLLPAFPMDGGRVLRALLTGPLGRLRATEIAAYLGVAIAMLMAAAGIYWFQHAPMLLLVGVFVFFAGQQELAAVRRREALRQAEPLDVLPVDAEPIQADGPHVRPGFTGAVWDSRAQVWVLWHNGRPAAGYGYPSE